MHSSRWPSFLPVVVLLVGPFLALVPGVTPAQSADALRIADDVMTRLGGQESWDATRFVRWRFFGGRLHFWDRHTGDIRIESPERKGEGRESPEILVLMNVHTKQGRVWESGQEITDPRQRKALLQKGHEWWVNDSYWMFMPYKLRDPGVRLDYVGVRAMEDGREADVLELTFEDVGYTPENRYQVFVAKETGLIEQWSFWASASDEEPGFTMPWKGWKPFGSIWLATGRGRDRDWDIAVFDELPPSVFEKPEPVAN